MHHLSLIWIQVKKVQNTYLTINNNDSVKYVLYPLKDKSVLSPSFKFEVSYCTTNESNEIKVDSIFVFQ